MKKEESTTGSTRKRNISEKIVYNFIEDEKKIMTFIQSWWSKIITSWITPSVYSLVFGLVLGIIMTGSLIFLFIDKTPNGIDPLTRNAIVEFFYPWTDKSVSKDVIETQIDTILKSEYPELELAIWFNESRGNPSAISKTGAAGPFQIVSGWVPKLIESKIIKNARDLHDPIKGCLAGDKVFGYHFTDPKVKGDLMAGLRDYVGSKEKPGNTEYVQKVLITYGNIKLLELAIKKNKAGADIDNWWLISGKDKKNGVKNLTPSPSKKKILIKKKAQEEEK